MYVNKGKLPTSGISQPILQLVILNLSSDRRKPFGFWRARFGAPKNLRSLFPSEVTEPNSLALREGYLKAGEARPTSIKGNHTLVHVIDLLFRDVKAVIIFINRQYSSLVVLLEGKNIGNNSDAVFATRCSGRLPCHFIKFTFISFVCKIPS